MDAVTENGISSTRSGNFDAIIAAVGQDVAVAGPSSTDDVVAAADGNRVPAIAEAGRTIAANTEEISANRVIATSDP